MESRLFGNGQPGVIREHETWMAKLERRLGSVESKLAFYAGGAVVAGVAVDVVWNLVRHL